MRLICGHLVSSYILCSIWNSHFVSIHTLKLNKKEVIYSSSALISVILKWLKKVRRKLWKTALNKLMICLDKYSHQKLRIGLLLWRLGYIHCLSNTSLSSKINLKFCTRKMVAKLIVMIPLFKLRCQ